MATDSQPLAPQDLQPVPQAPVRPSLFPREDPPFTGWDVALLFVALLALIFFVAIVGVAAAAIWQAQHGADVQAVIRKLAYNVGLAVMLQAIAYAFAMLLVHAYLRVRYRLSLARAVGWTLPTAGLAASLIFFGSTLAIFIAVLQKFVKLPKDLPIERMFQDPHSIYVVVAYAVIIAPIVEETFFRGLLYPVLNRRFGFIAAVVLTSFGFALIHASQLRGALWPLVLLFIVGVVLTLTRAFTRSIVPSIVVHMSYNGTLMLFLWLATDHFRHLDKVK